LSLHLIFASPVPHRPITEKHDIIHKPEVHIAILPDDHSATATDDMHKKLVKIRRVVLEISVGMDRQTD